MSVKVALKVKGPTRDETIEIKLSSSQVFTIGRKDCHLNLDDKRVSRRHVSLSIETGELVADDLGSHNGTLFHGEKISTQALGIGDTLELGDHSVTVESVDSDMEPVPVQSKPEPKPANAGVAEYSFYRDHSVTWQAIRDVYVLAVKRWRTFWGEIDYGISFESSVPILGIFAAVYGLVGAVHSRGMVAMLAAVSIAASTIGMVVFVAALLAAMRKWLQAKGDFDAYVVFGVYTAFLYFPVALVTTLLGKEIFFIAATLFFLWIVSGFVKAFQANVVRLIFLLIGVSAFFFGTLGTIGYVIFKAFRGN